jgi:beta-mannosidase
LGISCLAALPRSEAGFVFAAAKQAFIARLAEEGNYNESVFVKLGLAPLSGLQSCSECTNSCSMRTILMKYCVMLISVAVLCISSFAELPPKAITGWQMQDAAKVSAVSSSVAITSYRADGWYKATVPGTVLTTLVDNKVYPEPLYGENMRTIPESLNKTKYWYRTTFQVPSSFRGRNIWLHFGGVNYSAEVWVNGKKAGSMLGAFIRGDFNITELVKPGRKAALAVLVSPQPHPGTPHEHTVALGIGKNGGQTAIDGPTFLSTIGWDWLAAVRDRDTGIWLPVTLDSTGPVLVKDTFVASDLAASHKAADLKIATTLENLSTKDIHGILVGTVSWQGQEITTFRKATTVSAHGNRRD